MVRYKSLLEMNEEQLIRWKKQRKTTFIGFLIVGTIIGIDYSFMFSTLYLYLKDVVSTSRPGFYYGFIISSYCVSSSLSGIILGRLIDRYRKFRLLTNFVLVMQIIGILLYIIPSNVIYPIIGRTISGIGDPYTSICAGEVARCYKKEASTRYLWWLGSCYSIGFMIGPSLVSVFKGVEFHVGPLHFNQLNSVCMLIAGLLIVSLILSNFLVHDCSAVYDLKQSETDAAEQDVSIVNDEDIPNNPKGKSPTDESDHDDMKSDIEPNKNGSENIPEDKTDHSDHSSVPEIRVILKTLMQNIDCILFYISTLIFVYCWFAVDVFMPLITNEVLKWSLSRLTMIFTANGILYLFVIILSAKLFTSDRRIYYLLLLSTISLILTFVIIFLLKIYKKSLVTSALMMSILVILWATGVQEVLIRCMLAKKLPSNCQSFGEAIRNLFSRISMILAGLTIPLFVKTYDMFAVGVAISSFALLVAFVIRKRTLINISQLDIS